MNQQALCIEDFWRHANARDWDRFAALLHPAVVYEIPQTRERATGAEAFVDVFRTWPGDWRVLPTHVIADATNAVSLIQFIDGADVATGISLFEFDGGLIRKITDYWPAPYEPPARVSPHLRRRMD